MSINEVATKAKDLHDIRSMISELQEEADRLEEQLKAHMEAQGVDTMLAGSFKLTWKEIMSKRFDSSAFRKAMPDLADRFMKESASRRFVIA